MDQFDCRKGEINDHLHFRLLLRPHVPEDFEDYFSYIIDENLQVMLDLHDVTDRSSAQETFDWLRRKVEFLAVCPLPSGRTVGYICIHPANLSPTGGEGT